MIPVIHQILLRVIDLGILTAVIALGIVLYELYNSK